MSSSKIVAISMSRYNGGVKAKRQYGSSTLTTFAVGFEGQIGNYTNIETGGLTPGDRKTAAINKFKAMKGIV